MTIYFANDSKKSWYGEAIGILILDATYPCIPGNVGNATTYDFPVRYKVVKGATIERLLTQRDPALVQPFIDAARELEAEGVKAITGACGFMALFQQEIRRSVGIPVFMSSLLQVPFIQQIITPGKNVAVITADATAITPDHFLNVGINPETPLILAGMENCPEFSESVLKEKGSLDSDKIEGEIVGVARQLVQKHPDIGAFLLECSDLPPYAAAVFKETHLPVFDFITMIKHVYTTLTPTPYSGFM
ncbi:MAG: aspartate/glutamate racemase family protein [Desulfobacterium sp.]|nr:aspartate/glutamate racemase family protein [Desulfobacterium sp.]